MDLAGHLRMILEAAGGTAAAVPAIPV